MNNEENNTAAQGRKKRTLVIVAAVAIVALGAGGLWWAGVLGPMGGEVIVIVDGNGIQKAEFDWIMGETLKGIQASGQMVSEEMMQEVRRQVLQRVIDQQLVYERGRRLEMAASEEEVAQAMARRAASAGGEAALAASLEAQGIKRELLGELVEKEVVINKVIDLEMKDIRVSDAELRQTYDANKQSFNNAPEEIRASHILLMLKPGDDEGVLLSRAKEIREKALAGEDFGDLAASYSEEPGAAERKGDLGYFGRGQMVKPFEEAAFALKVGEVSTPVKTRFGYHVIKLYDRLPAGARNFAQAKETISRVLLEQKRRQRFMSFIAELRMQAEIEFKPGFEMPPPPGGIPAGR